MQDLIFTKPFIVGVNPIKICRKLVGMGGHFTHELAQFNEGRDALI